MNLSAHRLDPSTRSNVARDAFDVLETVEHLPADATGELVLEREGVPCGVVLVEKGRVCWAAARGLAQRLSDLLRAQTRPQLSKSEMEALFHHGREQHKPLGELLVESGLMAPDALLCSLRRHTAESLIEIGKTSVLARWSKRPAGTYEPRFTFTPFELALCVGALLDGRDPRATGDSLAEHGISWGAAFARRDSATLPIAATGVRTVSVLRRLAADAATSMDVATMIDDTTSFVFASGAHGGGLMTWRDGSLLIVGKIENRPHLARSLGLLTER